MNGLQPRHNLPTQATPLVGRQELTADARSTLMHPAVHWLTMSGPPGVGKTRLALQVAEEIADHFADGVRYVPLSHIARPDLVVSMVAQTLGLKEAGNKPLADRLKKHLRDKEMLLLLDNFEQVTGAALLISDILANAPGLKVFATSRTLLHVYGEHDFPVPPLSLPDPQSPPDLAALAECESVALFVQRARAAKPDFKLTAANAQAVAEICAHLEGLPLAIELAAARVRLLPPPAMVDRVAHRLHFLNGGAYNLPPRQQTLRGAIEWSYDLLSEWEQTLFRRLSVFEGGCTLEAAERVMADFDFGIANLEMLEGGSQIRVPSGRSGALRATDFSNLLDGIASLIDKSLLRQTEGAGGEPRYAMLETVREYAQERLAETGEADEMRRRHALYFMELAERGKPETQGAAQAVWLARLEAEYGNFRAALDWSTETGGQGSGTRSQESSDVDLTTPPRDPWSLTPSDVGLRLAGAMHSFWEMRGYLSEGRARLAAVLTCSAASENRRARARGLFAAGRLALLQGDEAAAEPFFLESLSLWRGTDDRLGISFSLVGLGHLAVHRGDEPAARDMFQEAFHLREELGDKVWIAHAFANLADLEMHRGEHVRARQLHEQGLVLAREAGDKSTTAFALLYLAYIFAHQSEYSQAAGYLEEAVSLYRELGTGHGMADCLAVYAKMAYAQNHHARAARLFGAAKARYDSIGIRMEPPGHTDACEYENAVAALQECLGEESFNAAWTEGQSLAPEQIITWDDHAPHALHANVPQPNPPSVTNLFPDAAGLTAREIEVLRLVALGMTNVQAADKLTISPHTINMHLRSIYSKLSVSSRIAATRYAIANRLV